jgi:hypothetical protein
MNNFSKNIAEKKILFIVALCLISTIIFCQNDTSQTHANNIDSLFVKYDRIYRLFLEQNNQEVKHLFKINFIGLNQLAPIFAFEQKLGKNFSFETSVGLGSTSKLDQFSTIYGFKDRSILEYGFYVSVYEMIKYYYNFNRRQRLGKIINGFSGNFLAVQLGGIYIHDEIFYQRKIDHELLLEIDLTYGIQRRIGNIGYIEPSVSLFLISDQGGIITRTSFNLEMGFAFDSFSNLDRMIRK